MKIKDLQIVSDRRDEVQQAVDEAILTALEAVGVQAVGYSVQEITAKGAIDTGLLRNSLTYALAGKPAKKTTYHAEFGSNRHKSGKNAGKRYTARSKNAGSVNIGKPYEGNSPEYGEKNHAVYIGTNVFYAPYVEFGTVKMKARPFLKDGVSKHKGDFQELMTKVMKKVTI